LSTLDQSVAALATAWRFCPRCAAPLEVRDTAGLMRQCCTQCDFVHWDNPLPVVAALIEWQGRMVIARNRAWPEGMYGLITGFLERHETPEEGIAREVHEETSLVVDELSLIGVYEFVRKNEIIIAYHARASGTIELSEELVDVKLVPPARLRPWRAGTGYAVADWMKARDLPFEFIDLPPRMSSTVAT
jgi:NADH pyrophosphatase NudC (nudix superfamily)